MRVPILCYHKVGEPEGRSLNVRVRDFRRQLAFLSRRYRFLRLHEWREATGRCVVLTFDDLYSASVDALLSAVRDFDATGTLFPVTGYVGDASRWDGERARPLADWQALALLREAGYEVGNHTHTHQDLTALPEAPGPIVFGEEPVESGRAAPLGTILAEIERASEELQRHLGMRPKSFAYPYGRFDARSSVAVRACGFRAAVTVQFGIATEVHDPHLLPRIVLSYSDGLAGLLYKLYLRPLLPPGGRCKFGRMGPV